MSIDLGPQWAKVWDTLLPIPINKEQRNKKKKQKQKKQKKQKKKEERKIPDGDCKK